MHNGITFHFASVSSSCSFGEKLEVVHMQNSSKTRQVNPPLGVLNFFKLSQDFLQQLSKKYNTDLGGGRPLENTRALSIMVPQSTYAFSVSEERNLSSAPGPHINFIVLSQYSKTL